jgi:hypothetical protein
MTARTDAQALHERRPHTALELDLDYCSNTYGVSPCTAGRIQTGTAQAGSANTLTLVAGASGVDGAYNNMRLALNSGPGSVQDQRITGYVGATKVATVDAPWRRNGLLWSEDFTNAVWTVGDPDNPKLPNTLDLQAPDGSWTACKWVLNDNTGNRSFGQSTPTAPANGRADTFSFYVWVPYSNVGPTLVAYMFASGEIPTHTINLNALPRGQWHRVAYTHTWGAGAGGVITTQFHANTSETVGDMIYVWRPQLETGVSTLGDYIKTTSAVVVNPDNTTVYAVVDRVGACYNVFAGESPCQDQANYVKGTKTVKFCTRGMPIPPGEQLRPYLLRASPTATKIDTTKGLAMRSQTSVTLTDEPARDDLDKYVDDRAAAAGGTFWPRLIARNPNAIGRLARLRKGYAVTPWDWATFQTELYAVEAIRGPDASGRIELVLIDPVKLLDRSKIPAVTDGKLIAEIKDVSFAGTLAGATGTTAVLPTDASPLDDAYNGQELAIVANTGAGQRRVITDYVGATRTAIVSAWAVTPNTTSAFEVNPLLITVTAGKGSQYADPATSGKNEYVRIGDEVIRYTAKSTDTLSWPDGTYRAQFSTSRATHREKSVVQLCRAWIDQPAKTVIEEIMNEGGVADAYIDLAGLAAEDTDWLQGGRITACIADPEESSALLLDLCKDLLMMCWWHPVEQKVKFKVDMPEIVSTLAALTDDDLVLAETQVERLDAERITAAALDFELASATADRKMRQNYRIVEAYIDATAQGANSYNDVRQDIRQSRWFTEANEVLARSNVARKLSRLRDAPSRLKFKLDPKDEVALGALVDITTRKMPDAAGNAKTVRCRIVSVVDAGARFEYEARTTVFARRYGFICPNGYPNYPSATADQRQRAFISSGATMSDGTSAYLIS